MTRREDLTLLISAITLTVVALLVITLEAQFSPTTVTSGDTAMRGLLTDPFLQLPTPSSVRVVWFTEFAGQQHTVAYSPQPAD
ncbi:MAG: metallophosphoesterase, partial [Cyanobacteria bacterium P01_C01_bin.147]